MKHLNLVRFVIILAFLAVNCKEKQKAKRVPTKTNSDKPNIVFIYVDDMGYGDLGCYGQKAFETPKIDKLVAEGMLFTQHYAGNTVCAPSRAALLTGKHTGHTSVRSNSPEEQLLKDDEMTIAKLLKGKGYKSAAIGKWGVGNDPKPDDPLRNGFDHFYGYINMWHAHNFYPEFMYRDGKKEKLAGNRTDWSYDYNKNMKEGAGVAKVKETYSLDVLEAEALNFIVKNRGNSFFLYYALNMPHANNEAGYFTGNGMEVPSYGQFADKNWPDPEKGFAESVTLIDKTVGKIEAKLQELGIADNSIIVFASDNGPHNEGAHDADFFDSNGIYRGYKRDLYEGGIRVPLIIKWPGTVKQGRVADNPVATWDFLPTFAEILTVDIPNQMDGVSFLPTLLGQPDKQGSHAYLYWEFYELGGRQAIREGDWKLIKLNVRDQLVPVVQELYNIVEDPSESYNMINQYPEKASKLDSVMVTAHEKSNLLSLFPEDMNAEKSFRR